MMLKKMFKLEMRLTHNNMERKKLNNKTILTLSTKNKKKRIKNVENISMRVKQTKKNTKEEGRYFMSC